MPSDRCGPSAFAVGMLRDIKKKSSADTYGGVARTYDAMGGLDTALQYYSKALDAELRQVYSYGPYSYGLQYYSKALDAELRQVGEDHLDTAMAQRNVADVLRRQV